MMEDNSKVNGLTIKCMVMESLLGLMEKVTKVSTLKMKNKAKADSIMEMDRFIKATGLKEDSMEEESLEIKVVKYTKVVMSTDN